MTEENIITVLTSFIAFSSFEKLRQSLKMQKRTNIADAIIKRRAIDSIIKKDLINLLEESAASIAPHAVNTSFPSKETHMGINASITTAISEIMHRVMYIKFLSGFHLEELISSKTLSTLSKIIFVPLFTNLFYTNLLWLCTHYSTKIFCFQQKWKIYHIFYGTGYFA
jgi:hypothetical protein